MSKCLRCDFAEWNSPWGPFIVVVVISKFFAKFFHCHIFQRPSSWRENLNQMQSQPFGQALNTLNSNIESVNAFAMSFADIHIHIHADIHILHTGLSRWTQWRQILTFQPTPLTRTRRRALGDKVLTDQFQTVGVTLTSGWCQKTFVFFLPSHRTARPGVVSRLL